MKTSEIKIRSTYVIGTCKETDVTAHNFEVGQKVTIKERILSTGFIAQCEKTGVEQLIEASDLKKEIEKTSFSTTLSREDMVSFIDCMQSGCNMASKEVRDKTGISMSQHKEVLSNFLEIKKYYDL